MILDIEDLIRSMENNRKAKVLNEIPTPFIAVDNDLNIYFLNEAAASFIGTTQEGCHG